MNPNGFLILAAGLFLVGAMGALIRKNVFFILLGIELMLNSVNLTFVTFGRMWGNGDGQIYAFFVMALAAAEARVGLSIVVLFFRRRESVLVDDAREMGN